MMEPKSKYLLNALFKHSSHYGAILPYNLNWQIKLDKDDLRLLREHPLVVSDVGARGVAPDELAPFFSTMTYHAFDADTEACKRLKRTPHPYREFTVFPYYVGRSTGATDFNLYKCAWMSSHYPPDKRFRNVFAGADFEVERQLTLDSTSLDDIYAKEGVALPDFLKLDTQGSELEILLGADRIIDGACMVEIEVEFLAMYEGQPLIASVLTLMNEKGFDLLYLNRVFGQRTAVYDGLSRGQLIFGDALFGRREDRLEGFSQNSLVKYILLLINYGHLDFAYHLLVLHPDLDKEFPTLKAKIRKKGAASRVKRGLVGQFDKLILLLLHARTSNRLQYDSDRSWPIR
jgi:FkbM family methyltransferase